MSPKKKKPRVSLIDYRVNNKSQSIQNNSSTDIYHSTIRTSSSNTTVNSPPNLWPKEEGLDFKSFRNHSFTHFQNSNLIVRTIIKSMSFMKKKIIWDDNLPSHSRNISPSKRLKIEDSFQSHEYNKNYPKYNLFIHKSRLFLEDFMTLDSNKDILLLIPTKTVHNDIDLMKIKDLLYPSKCQLSSTSSHIYYLFQASTISCTNVNTKDESTSQEELETKGYTILLQNSTLDLVHEYFISWNDILIGKDTGIQIWSEISQIRDCKLNFKNKFKNETHLEKLLHWIYLELYGDAFQIYFTISRYYAAVLRKKQYLLSNIQKNSIQLNNIQLCGNIYKEVITEIDNKFLKAIQECYSTFCSLTQPLISSKTVKELIQLYMNKLPHHYNLMKSMLGYDKREKMSKNLHLRNIGYYNKLLFYQFLIQSRVRNPHNCIHWAMVSAAASYARGGSNNSGFTTSSSFFAHSTTIKTFFVKTKLWRENMSHTIKKELSPIKNFMCSLDNNQKGQPLKYQRFGSSNTFVKVTAFIIKEFVCDELFMDDLSGVDISYVNQKIPSAYLMPHFELLYDNDKECSINEYNLLTLTFSLDPRMK